MKLLKSRFKFPSLISLAEAFNLYNGFMILLATIKVSVPLVAISIIITKMLF